MNFLHEHPHALHIIRIGAALLLAVLTALGIMYGVLSWRASHTTPNVEEVSVEDEQKLAILAQLSTNSTSTETERRDVLKQLKENSAPPPSEEEKLKILQGL